jgi:hypothetical protein
MKQFLQSILNKKNLAGLLCFKKIRVIADCIGLEDMQCSKNFSPVRTDSAMEIVVRYDRWDELISYIIQKQLY